MIDENGRPFLEIDYNNGVAHGPYIEYWSNGIIATEGQFRQGQQGGVWRYYNLDGSLSEIIHFKEGRETTKPLESGNVND